MKGSNMFNADDVLSPITVISAVIYRMYARKVCSIPTGPHCVDYSSMESYVPNPEKSTQKTWAKCQYHHSD